MRKRRAWLLFAVPTTPGIVALGIVALFVTLAVVLNPSWSRSVAPRIGPPVQSETPAAPPAENQPKSEASEAAVPPGDPGEPEGPVLFAASANAPRAAASGRSC